ncbi:MAG: hypothetical protein VX642_05935 [Bdellovibrionota bacterium]|nr:hypothetical protein [Bdellovibrionota bacterium]
MNKLLTLLAIFFSINVFSINDYCCKKIKAKAPLRAKRLQQPSAARPPHTPAPANKERTPRFGKEEMRKRPSEKCIFSEF